MPDKKLTDKEIVKALEYWKEFYAEIDKLMSRYPQEDKMLLEQKEIVEITFKAFDLINRLQTKNKELDEKLVIYKGTIDSQVKEINRLQAENEEKEDTIQFADKIYKEQVAENKRLVNAVNRLTNKLCDLKEKDETRHKVFETKCEELEIAKAENERLKAKVNHYNYCYENFVNTPISRIKSEAYKEFAELLHCQCESIINQPHNENVHPISWKVAYEEFDEKIDNLLKELVGEDNAKEKE